LASIVDFDSQALERLIAEFGLREAWLSILKTNLIGREDLSYVFSSPCFKEAHVLADDLIAGLSVGEISVLYEFSHAVIDSSARKDNGLFFTPDDVAAFMASFAERFPKGVWLDPCSGIGNLSWHLVAAQEDPEDFLLNNMILTDKDELALLIARTILTAGFQRNESQLFHKIEDRFIVLDFLSVAEEATLVSLKGSLGEIPIHDYVIVNPPYLQTAADPAFETRDARDLYAYFLENVIKTSSGFISVTPQSFTNASKFASLRQLILRHFSNITILCFDNIPGNIFPGIKFGSVNSNSANSTRASIMVALPDSGTPKITSLFRWKTSERSRLFLEVERFTSEVPLTPEFFPKVSRVFEDLYLKSRSWKQMKAITAAGETEFPLFVPSSPRYFIAATKTKMDRSSQHTIYFPNEASRNHAYLAINSSLMYWWWRVRDGGMTLSRETLLSLPMPKFRTRPELVARLAESEAVNRVYKQNAGGPRENVKHPPELLAELNLAVCSSFAPQLMSAHENSEFVQVDYLPIPDLRSTEARANTN